MMKIVDAGSSLPPDRAFVVQLQETAGEQWLSGRVEHVISGCARRFDSVEEILGFMEQTLRRLEQEKAEARRIAQLGTAIKGKRRAKPAPAVIRFVSSRLGVRDRLEAKLAKSA